MPASLASDWRQMESPAQVHTTWCMNREGGHMGVIVRVYVLVLPALNACGDNNCEQFCSNQGGSPVCSCSPGFNLGQDEKSCNGMFVLIC